MTPLEEEIRTYNAKLPELLSDLGKFVLIKGSHVKGIYDTYNDALKAGYETHKEGGFLVKKIAPAEQVLSFTRDLLIECRA